MGSFELGRLEAHIPPQAGQHMLGAGLRPTVRSSVHSVVPIWQLLWSVHAVLRPPEQLTDSFEVFAPAPLALSELIQPAVAPVGTHCAFTHLVKPTVAARHGAFRVAGRAATVQGAAEGGQCGVNIGVLRGPVVEPRLLTNLGESDLRNIRKRTEEAGMMSRGSRGRNKKPGIERARDIKKGRKGLCVRACTLGVKLGALAS